MKTNRENLMPCPFCGGEVSIAIMNDGTCDDLSYFMITRGTSKDTRCKCRIFMESEQYAKGDKERVKNELIKSWNSRAERTATWAKCEDGSVTCSACGRRLSNAAYGYPYAPCCGAKIIG